MRNWCLVSFALKPIIFVSRWKMVQYAEQCLHAFIQMFAQIYGSFVFLSQPLLTKSQPANSINFLTHLNDWDYSRDELVNVNFDIGSQTVMYTVTTKCRRSGFSNLWADTSRATGTSEGRHAKISMSQVKFTCLKCAGPCGGMESEAREVREM